MDPAVPLAAHHLANSRQCTPLQGTAGQLLAVFLGAAAILIYAIIWSVSPSDKRTTRIFALDLSKIAISGSFAWAVNLGIAHVSSQFVSHTEFPLQAVAWYGAVLVTDTIVGVPLGVYMGQRFMSWCAGFSQRYEALHPSIARRERGKKKKKRQHRSGTTNDNDCEGAYEQVDSPSGGGGSSNDDDRAKAVMCCEDGEDDDDVTSLLYEFAVRNATYGKYWPEEEQRLAAVKSREEFSSGSFHLDESEILDKVTPKPRWDWWLAQLASWSLFVIISRALSGALMLTMAQVLRSYDPVFTFALLIHEWNVPCHVKQVAIVGILRLILDVLQVAVIDLFNHFDFFRAVYSVYPFNKYSNND